MNLLLDTNVVIDYLGRKEPFFAAAQQIVAAGFFGDVRLWMPAQSAADAFYVLNRYVDSARIQGTLLKLFEVVAPVALTADDLARAAHLQWDDYEDCLVSLAAGKVGANYVVTRDERGFARSAVPAIRPEDLLRTLREEKGLEYEVVEL